MPGTWRTGYSSVVEWAIELNVQCTQHFFRTILCYPPATPDTLKARKRTNCIPTSGGNCITSSKVLRKDLEALEQDLPKMEAVKHVMCILGEPGKDTQVTSRVERQNRYVIAKI